MTEKWKYTDAFLAEAEEFMAKYGRGGLTRFAELKGISLNALYVTRFHRRHGIYDGNQVNAQAAWLAEQSNVIRAIRCGITVAQLARGYEIHVTTMHERLRNMGLTPDIRTEIARGEWDDPEAETSET